MGGSLSSGTINLVGSNSVGTITFYLSLLRHSPSFATILVIAFKICRKSLVFILKNKSGEVEKKIFLNTAETYLRTLKAVEGKFKNADELLAQGQTDEARELRLKAEGYRDAIKFGIEKGTIKVDNFTDNQKKEFSEILDRLYK